MNREFSPEERLLHLIKGKNKNERDSEAAKSNIKSTTDIPVISTQNTTNESGKGQDIKRPQPAGPEKTGNDAKGDYGRKIPKITFNIKYLIPVFIILTIFTGLFFLFNAMSAKDDEDIENIKQLIASLSYTVEPGMPKDLDKVPAAAEKPAAQERQRSDKDYDELIKARSIFAPPVTGPRKTVAAEGPVLAELVKDLRLVGIIPGDVPQAIIEDRKNNQTLFLKQGEMVNNILVKNISTGRVVLEYNDQTITLSL